jgi:hypothetical protein
MDIKLLKKTAGLRELTDLFYNFFIYVVPKGKLQYK